MLEKSAETQTRESVKSTRESVKFTTRKPVKSTRESVKFTTRKPVKSTRKSVKSVESIFSYIRRERIGDNSVVVSAENPFGELGYEVCNVESDAVAQESLSRVINFYYEDVARISYADISEVLKGKITIKRQSLIHETNENLVEECQNETTQNYIKQLDKAIFKEINGWSSIEKRVELMRQLYDLNRSRMALPDFVPIKKDGQYYVGIIEEGAIVVTKSQPIGFMREGMTETEIRYGLEMKNFLFKGKNGRKYLDIISILPHNSSCQVLFSFSGMSSPLVVPAASYLIKQHDGKEISLSFPTTIHFAFCGKDSPPSQEIFSPLQRTLYLSRQIFYPSREAEIYSLLHEFGHLHAIENKLYPTLITKAEDERRSHAFALLLARKINTRYKFFDDEVFFDLKECMRLAENALITHDFFSGRSSWAREFAIYLCLNENKRNPNALYVKDLHPEDLLRLQSSTAARNSFRRVYLSGSQSEEQKQLWEKFKTDLRKMLQEEFPQLRRDFFK